MNKMLSIMRREYVEIVRKKSFIIGLFVVPIIIGGAMFVPILLMKMKVQEQRRLAVLDGTGRLYDHVVSQLDGELKDGRPEYVIRPAPAEDDPLEAQKALTEEINRDKLDAFIVIPHDLYENRKAEYFGKTVGNLSEIRRFQSVLTEAVVSHRLGKEGLDPEAVKAWTKRVNLSTVKIVKGQQRRGGFAQEFVGSFIFAMMLYMMLILYDPLIIGSEH